MLRNNFYQVQKVQTSEQQVDGELHFDAAHDIFKGHFPNQPVVPGVCSLQIIKELLEEQLGDSLQLSSASQVKFLQLLTPELSPTYLLKWEEQEAGISLNASFKIEKEVFKFSGIYHRKSK